MGVRVPRTPESFKCIREPVEPSSPQRRGERPPRARWHSGAMKGTRSAGQAAAKQASRARAADSSGKSGLSAVGAARPPGLVNTIPNRTGRGFGGLWVLVVNKLLTLQVPLDQSSVKGDTGFCMHRRCIRCDRFWGRTLTGKWGGKSGGKAGAERSGLAPAACGRSLPRQGQTGGVRAAAGGEDLGRAAASVVGVACCHYGGRLAGRGEADRHRLLTASGRWG